MEDGGGLWRTVEDCRGLWRKREQEIGFLLWLLVFQLSFAFVLSSTKWAHWFLLSPPHGVIVRLKVLESL